MPKRLGRELGRVFIHEAICYMARKSTPGRIAFTPNFGRFFRAENPTQFPGFLSTPLQRLQSIPLSLAFDRSVLANST